VLDRGKGLWHGVPGAADLLIDLIQGGEPTRPQPHPVEVKVRESTAKPMRA